MCACDLVVWVGAVLVVACGGSSPSDAPSPVHCWPIMSDRSPTGSLPAGTRTVELSLSTDRPATCRWDTIEGVHYLEMSHAFERTGGTTHATPVTGLEDGRSYRYFVKCEAPPDCATPHDLIYSFTIGN